jgi:hypothetical protein
MGNFFFNVIVLFTLAGTYQLLRNANEDNTLSVIVQTIRRNTEALVVGSKEMVWKEMLKKLSKWLCLGMREGGSASCLLSLFIQPLVTP